MLFTLAIAALALAQDSGGPVEPRLLRYPSVHGNTVVFSYAGDLWVSHLNGGAARRLTSFPGLETRPKISPDGTTVAFTGSYDGSPNVYTIPIEGGEPKRLTFDTEPDSVLGWTPDGKIAYATVAETYTLNRQQRLFFVDPKGGLPQTTPVYEITEGTFFPDGHTLAYTRFNSYAFNWRRYRGGSQGTISVYDMAANRYSELPHQREQNYFPMVVGRAIYYISDRNQATLNLYRYDLDHKTDVQLTHYTDADIRYPSTDGKTIVWERDGFLWAYDIASGAARQVSPTIRAENLTARPYLRSLGTSISGVTLSPSGARVAVEARGRIFSVPVHSGDTRDMTNAQGVHEKLPQWSPDGQTIAYASDASGEYEIYTRPQMGGTPTKLTTQPLDVTGLTWSPDGKSLAVVTTHDLYVLDVESHRLTHVAHGDYGPISNLDWSPDSNWIAYLSAGRNQFASLYLYNLDAGKSTQVTSGHFDDDDVAFDQNGKYLYLVSTRSFHPTSGEYEYSLKVEDAQRIYVAPLAKETGNPLVAPDEEEPVAPTPAAAPPGPIPPSLTPPGQTPPTGPAASRNVARSGSTPTVKIDLDGFEERMIPLPMPPSNYALVGMNNAVLFLAPGGTIARFDLNTRQVEPVAQGFFGSLAFNPSHTKMAYYLAGVLGVVDIRPGIQLGQGRVDTGAVEAVIDPRAEWRQEFWEAWRYERDHYYDPNMRGLDWKAIGERYSHYLDYVNNRTDLNVVLGLMIGELGTGHSYVIGGDLGNMPRPIPVGHLGADYEVSGGKIRFKRIYRGENFEEDARGPLGEPGADVKEGDYLLEIDGHPVDANTNPDSLLVDKAGRYVTLTVADNPGGANSRKIRVRPVVSEGTLRYREWAADNRRLVDKLSGGHIGYMHIENTATEGAIDFIRGFYPQTDKDAMIVDERWNGGGFIQPWFIDTLARREQAGIQPRDMAPTGDARAIGGPKAMLINGYAGSGGDFFPWMFRHSNLGPLIGKRTWGGLVGINEQPVLVDGGIVTAPEFAIYDQKTDEIIAENHGIDPDIDVDMRPDLVAEGHDPQLEAAVKYLMDQLRKNPPPTPPKDLPHVNREGVVH